MQSFGQHNRIDGIWPFWFFTQSILLSRLGSISRGRVTSRITQKDRSK